MTDRQHCYGRLTSRYRTSDECHIQITIIHQHTHKCKNTSQPNSVKEKMYFLQFQEKIYIIIAYKQRNWHTDHMHTELTSTQSHTKSASISEIQFVKNFQYSKEKFLANWENSELFLWINIFRNTGIKKKKNYSRFQLDLSSHYINMPGTFQMVWMCKCCCLHFCYFLSSIITTCNSPISEASEAVF